MNAYELADKLNEWYNFSHENMCNEAAQMLRQQADRIADLETTLAFKKMKPLNDEEIYALWCEADNTELLPEMRLKDGSINYIITTFAKLIEERHGIK